jgi:hypothetical protein
VIEDITAHLTVKDAARFEAEMYAAAASVDEFGDEELKAAVKAKALQHETEILERKMRSLSRGGLRAAQKDLRKFGALAVFTERGVTSFAITIGTYLAPALLSLGNSAAAAALGGAGVAGGGLASLAVGLSGIALIGAQVLGQTKKVQTAWEQQQLAVQLYGKDSDQAAKAGAKLWAVIQQQGGTRTFRIVQMWQNLQDTFTKQTGPGRNAMAKALSDILSSVNRLLPTFTSITNQSAIVVSSVAKTFARNLSGEEMKGTLAVLGGTFKQIAGPLGKAFENVIITIGRVFKASAPYVVEFAQWFLKLTTTWRKSSRDQTQLDRTMANLVEHFKAWARLGSAIGRMFKILFGGSKEQGRQFVDTLTDLITRFDDWLQRMSDTGKMQAWFEQFFDNLRSLGNWVNLVFTDQSQAIAQVSDFFAKVASQAVQKFFEAWLKADWQGKLLMAWYFLYKVGIFSAIGRVMAERFIASFIASSTASAAMAQFTAAGSAASAAFMAGLMGALPFLIVLSAALAIESISIGGKKLTSPGKGPLDKAADEALERGGGLKGAIEKWLPHNWLKRIQGKQFGGLIPFGSEALVGERGTELASTTPLGTMITPIGTRTQTLSEFPGVPPMATSDHMPQVNINLQVDRQTLAKAVYRHNADIAARRGENA